MKITFIVLVLCCLLGGISSAEESKSEWSYKSIKELASKGVSDTIAKTLGESGGNKLFYFPITISDELPSKYGYAFEDIKIRSLDQTILNAWVIPTEVKKPKGVVVFSHGNTGSINSHFFFCAWLVKEGYHLVISDYRGYGKSEGFPARKGMIEDIVSTLNYASNRKEWAGLPIVSFGHSLGGAKSIVALDLIQDRSRIKAAVFWAGFSSYVKIANKMVGETAEKIVTDEWSPLDHIGKLRNLPLLFLHGKKDGVVPVSHSEELYTKAKARKKLILSMNGGHNNTLWIEEKKVQQQMLEWLDTVLSS